MGETDLKFINKYTITNHDEFWKGIEQDSFKGHSRGSEFTADPKEVTFEMMITLRAVRVNPSVALGFPY